MDAKNCYSSGSTGSIQLGRYYDELESMSSTTSSRSSSNKPILWKLIWKKLKKEKSKVIMSPRQHVRVSYDAYSYSQNFDEGSTWDEPDNLSRSFSVRFSDPSRISAIVNQQLVL
ncbi:uncharacterized protein LOC132278847 [Cornus florida]|uniref:uncharacterized protein LOC132278847 n=1 Tax=Cornus florida TaxID=4283 RepID=UPI00289E7CC3|nr:uncharacterized protein LOC132278847 [Cornus florida]